MAQTVIRHNIALSARSTNPEPALGSGLNSLASASSATSAAISNDASTEGDLLADAELVLGSITPTGTPYCELYLLSSVDSANYADAPGELVGVFPITTGASAKRALIRDIPVPPKDHKWAVKNVTGQTLAGSGNALNVLYHGPAVGT